MGPMFALTNGVLPSVLQAQESKTTKFFTKKRRGRQSGPVNLAKDPRVIAEKGWSSLGSARC